MLAGERRSREAPGTSTFSFPRSFFSTVSSVELLFWTRLRKASLDKTIVNVEVAKFIIATKNGDSLGSCFSNTSKFSSYIMHVHVHCLLLVQNFTYLLLLKC